MSGGDGRTMAIGVRKMKWIVFIETRDLDY